ncbi:MAG: hypothetical protein LQ339_002857 [Xanthoria mediterranea]|nr:MAG: hypothetical protein LQ339_002857 [Xanthoria mediterranea]
MLDCKACIGRCITTILADVLRPLHQSRVQPQSLPTLKEFSLLPTAGRAYHSARPTRSNLSRKDGLQNRRHSKTRHQTTQAVSANGLLDTPPQLPIRKTTFNPKGFKPFYSPGQRNDALEFEKRKKQRHLGKELRYLQDPLKLAENTIDLLRKDDHVKALDLVRQASKTISCTVSWNHLVDYSLSTGRAKDAVKIYNEMKKRAQVPDAQTYTIIFRGLAWHPHPEISLPLALKIYHSMFADKCPVKPNIIHTNAVLKVCALARDMDALWGVAAKLPPEGLGAPNNLTFTTILNAIRVIAWNNDKDLGDEEWEEKSLRRQRAVMQGRQIWEEVIPRWRAGDMFIDEELACAMGRLLLLGSTERDYDDVLSLAEQVMGLPRQKRPLGEPQEITHDENSAPVTPGTTDAEQLVLDEAFQGESRQLDFYGNHAENNGEDNASSPPVPVLNSALANVFQPRPSSALSASVPPPGRNTLSLVLDACINLRAIPSAQAYWGLLTDPSGPYKVKPDSANYHMYLRVLRVQRASKAASEMINDMYSGDLKSMQLLQPKTFRIALSACVRNSASPGVMEHATQILKIMYKSLGQPDFKAMEMFVQLASMQTRRDYHITLEALREMETGMRLFRSFIDYGGADEDGTNGTTLDEATRTAGIDLAKRLLGLYDRVWHAASDGIERDVRSYIISRRTALQLWMRRKLDLTERKRGIGATTKRLKPMPEGTNAAGGEMISPSVYLFRKQQQKLKMQREARRGVGIGLRKRALRAKKAVEGSGEFADFVEEDRGRRGGGKA